MKEAMSAMRGALSSLLAKTHAHNEIGDDDDAGVSTQAASADDTVAAETAASVVDEAVATTAEDATESEPAAPVVEE
jgi:hypothetical protein